MDDDLLFRSITSWAPNLVYGRSRLVNRLERQKKPMDRFKTAEAFFHDQDLFLIYVEDTLNPIRAENGLKTISRSEAAACYNTIYNGLHRAAKTPPETTHET